MQLTVCLPRHVQPRGTSNVNCADTHAMQVIQCSIICQTLDIATKSELCLFRVVLEFRLEEVVVRGITIEPLIEQNGHRR